MKSKLTLPFLLVVSLQFCAVLTLDCLICTASPNQPLKCTRPEHEGIYKSCPEGTNACFKSVDINTGELNKGCASSDMATPSAKSADQETFLCYERLCNSANIISRGLPLLSLSLLVLIIL